MRKWLLVCVLALPLALAACGGTPTNDTATVLDTGYTTLPAPPPASVPAYASGITPD